MAITRTYTENQSSSNRSTWTFTASGNNVTASGSTFSIAAPTVTASYTGSNKGYADVEFVSIDGLNIGGIATSASFSYYCNINSSGNPKAWTSGTSKTCASGGSASLTLNTASFFNASNKTSRTLYVSVSEGYASTTSAANSAATTRANGYYGSITDWTNFLEVTLNAPPTFSSTQVSFTNDYAGVPYANLTTANVTLSSLAAYYGGDFTGVGKAEFTIGSATVSKANPANNDTLSIALNAVGTFTPIVKVTDSRGQTSTITLNAITVMGYTAPTVTFDTERTLSSGAPNDEGTYAVINPKFTFTDAIATLSAPTVGVTDDGGVARTPTVTWYSTRAADGTLSGSVTWSSLSSGDSVYGLVSITNGFNTQKSYQISVTPQDSEDSGTAITQTLGSAFYTVDFYAGGHGIAFGQPASTEGFECNMSALFKDDLLLDLPEYSTSGTTDKAIYDAVVSLGWDSDVLVN